MARVEIVRTLFEEIEKKFKKDAEKIFDLMETLEENPTKRKLLGSVGGLSIKELKYKNFRFYFLTDGFRLKCINKEDLTDLLLKFVRMSDKKHQQEIINEIKHILLTLEPSGF